MKNLTNTDAQNVARERGWDTDLAAERAQAAYRYVADVYPRGVSYAPLDAHTEAAYEAEQRGELEAFTRALRALCEAARDEARRAA